MPLQPRRRCRDATTTAARFAVGLGMQLVAKSDLTTGNARYASYVLQSNDLRFVFSAPYDVPEGEENDDARSSMFEKSGVLRHDPSFMRTFCERHGLAVRAVCLLVDDAAAACLSSMNRGGRSPAFSSAHNDSTNYITFDYNATNYNATTSCDWCARVSEVELYGDVVLRYYSFHAGEKNAKPKTFLPGYADVPLEPPHTTPLTYGLQRLDHAVGNVPNLLETVDYITAMTGMHEFAEFTAEDVGTVDSGLNSMVLANNDEMILLPVNEPTFGTKRKSQIQTYLECNNGAGLQHLALKSDDVFATVREMRKHGGGRGGFEFQKPASADYYANLKARVGEDALTERQFKEVEELGLLVDRDDQGVLVQIFTKPLGDRPTVFIEIIQRIGCLREVKSADANAPPRIEQAGGCGGFGKGNFSELFKSVENYERTLKM